LRNRWFADASLEGSGFEPLVPREKGRPFETTLMTSGLFSCWPEGPEFASLSLPSESVSEGFRGRCRTKSRCCGAGPGLVWNLIADPEIVPAHPLDMDAQTAEQGESFRNRHVTLLAQFLVVVELKGTNGATSKGNTKKASQQVSFAHVIDTMASDTASPTSDAIQEPTVRTRLSPAASPCLADLATAALHNNHDGRGTVCRAVPIVRCAPSACQLRPQSSSPLWSRLPSQFMGPPQPEQ
jgi:hypothetical protein